MLSVSCKFPIRYSLVRSLVSLSRGFSHTRTCFIKQDRMIPVPKKVNNPKTLEELHEISIEKDLSSVKEAGPVKKSNQSTKPLDTITTGPKIPDNWRKMTSLPEWKRQKFALIEKFEGQKWNPKKKLSREDMKSVKILKQTMPELTNTDLSQHFQVSPEAIRRILKSSWKPTLDEEEDVYERWKQRGEKIKLQMKEMDIKNGKTPKVLISSGKDYDSVRYSKDGELSVNYKGKQVMEQGASERVRRLNNNSNKLRKMKF